MITREDAEKKVALINNKLKNEDYEEALILLESIPSEVLENYDKIKLGIIEKLFYKLINNKKFDEAIRKIDAYKRKYYYFSTDLQKIESQIYFYLAEKENDEKKVDSALSYSEKSVSLDKNNENAKFLIIRILIFDKEFYDKALEKISDLEACVSNEKKNILKNLKAAALNNKSNNLAITDLEGSLNLINKAIEIEPTENLEMLKKNRLERFKKVFVQKILDKKLEEIPKLFEKGNKYKFKSKEMENYLDINKHISKCFEYKYLQENANKEIYESIILNTLEYIRKGLNEDNFELKFELLKAIFSEDIEKNSDLFLKQVKQNNNKNVIFNYKVELELYENIINKINNYITRDKDNIYYIKLKSHVLYTIAKIYFEKDNTSF